MWKRQGFRRAFLLIFCFVLISIIIFLTCDLESVRGIRIVSDSNAISTYSNLRLTNELPTLNLNDTIVTKKPFVEEQKVVTNSNLTELLSRNFYQYLVSQLNGTVYPGVENYTEYIITQKKLKPLPGVQPIRPDFGPVLNNVTSFQYPINIQPCKNINVNGSLFVAIISGAGNFERRESIRQSWLLHFVRNESHLLAGHGFIIGLTADNKIQMQIEEESKKYGDILQIDFMDNYYNLTTKVVGLVNWIYTNCSTVDFVFKTDDDGYVNVRNVVALTKTLNATQENLYGTLTNTYSAQRVTKWAISYEAWPWKSYPPYPTGGTILYPGVIIKNLLAAAQTVPFVPFEDVYMNGLCAEKAKIKTRYSKRIYAGDSFPSPDACHVYNSVTWGTKSINNLNVSHLATEDFYKGKTHCVISNSSSGLNYTVNPMETVNLSFTSL